MRMVAATSDDEQGGKGKCPSVFKLSWISTYVAAYFQVRLWMMNEPLNRSDVSRFELWNSL